MDVTLEPEKEFRLMVPKEHTVVAYLFEGAASFGEDAKMIDAARMMIFEDGDHIRVRAGSSPARFMLIAGAPIKEPIVPYGPFVMNTEGEIRQTLMDIRNGTFVQKNAQVIRLNRN